MTRSFVHAARGLATLALLAALTAPAAAAPSWEVAIANSTEPGARLVLELRVCARSDSQPLRDVTVRVWHADAHGSYGATAAGRFGALEGRARTNVAGGIRVRTVLPGPAEGFPHVHYEVRGPNVETAAGTINLARSHGAGSDTAYAKLPYMLDPTASQTWAFVEPDDAGFHASCRVFVRRAAPR